MLIPQNQTTADAIIARRWVTRVWYDKAYLMARKRSTLIKARWRIIMALTVRLSIDATLHNWWRGVNLGNWMFVMCRINTNTISISATAKLTSMVLETVRRFANLLKALTTRRLPRTVTIISITYREVMAAFRDVLKWTLEKDEFISVALFSSDLSVHLHLQ